MVFRRLVLPLAMVIEERGISKKSARKLITASLALPSIGGAVRASLRASPTIPVMPFLRAGGWTLTAKLIPAEVCFSGIIAVWASRQRWQCPRGCRLSLLQSRFQNRVTCPWRARPSGSVEHCGRQSGRADRAIFGSRGARPQVVQCKEESSSGRALQDVAGCLRLSAFLPIQENQARFRFCFLHRLR